MRIAKAIHFYIIKNHKNYYFYQLIIIKLLQIVFHKFLNI